MVFGIVGSTKNSAGCCRIWVQNRQLAAPRYYSTVFVTGNDDFSVGTVDTVGTGGVEFRKSGFEGDPMPSN